MDTVQLEIRAGAGGEEANLFARDLFRMYQRFAEKSKWDFKALGDLEALIKGENVFGFLQHEAGVHRVQRIPKTERYGRIHTSTASVAVLKKDEVQEIKITPNDLRIDTYRSSGPGGQHVNKTSSAVRITHLPTGMVVACQDGRSQLANREKAMMTLEQRLVNLEKERFAKGIGEERKDQVGAAERSEKIRTYNFPQNRITDHRLNQSWQNLDQVLEGGPERIIGP